MQSQYPLLLPSPSTRRQAWELQQLHVTIPGEAEADWIFTAGLSSITPVRWSEYTLPSPSVSFLSRVPKKI
jgi:hypothetical protein